MKSRKITTRGQNLIQCYEIEINGKTRCFGKIKSEKNLWVLATVNGQETFIAKTLNEAEIKVQQILG